MKKDKNQKWIFSTISEDSRIGNGHFGGVASDLSIQISQAYILKLFAMRSTLQSEITTTPTEAKKHENEECVQIRIHFQTNFGIFFESSF